MAYEPTFAPGAMDAESENLRRRYALAQELQKPLSNPQGGQMVGNYFVANPWQSFADVYRAYKGREQEDALMQEAKDLQATRQQQMADALSTYGKMYSGTPEQKQEIAQPVFVADDNGGGEMSQGHVTQTTPAIKGSPMAAAQFLASQQNPMLAQVGMHQLTKLPEINATKEAQLQQALFEMQNKNEERAKDRQAREDNIRLMASLAAANRQPHQAQIIQTDQGPMQLVNGQAVPIMGANNQPIKGGSTRPPSAEYTKSATALLDMNDALKNYSAKLDTFKPQDMLNPAKRAEMGTAYQNALLQAKEMYKLGVLNGPDERILKSIIDNPMDWKTSVTPTSALKQQATDLQNIIQRNAARLSQVHNQPELQFDLQKPAGGAKSSGNVVDFGSLK